MNQDISTSRRELVTRVATLELLVADLIDLLWRLDPVAMEKLGQEAAHDLAIQNSRTVLPGGEHQRERLYGVLQDRRRRLQHRRGAKAAAEA
jgi:hypothetical protein